MTCPRCTTGLMIPDGRFSVVFWRCLICGERHGDLCFEINRWRSKHRIEWHRRRETAAGVFVQTSAGPSL